MMYWFEDWLPINKKVKILEDRLTQAKNNILLLKQENRRLNDGLLEAVNALRGIKSIVDREFGDPAKGT